MGQSLWVFISHMMSDIFWVFLTYLPTRVSNGKELCSATFWDKGTEIPLLSRGKGTTGQAQNLAAGRDRPGQSVKTWDRTGFWYFATGRDEILTACPGQSRDNHRTKGGKKMKKIEKKKFEFLFLFLFFFKFWALLDIFCPGTSQDRGVCPRIKGQWNVPSQIVLGHPVETLLFIGRKYFLDQWKMFSCPPWNSNITCNSTMSNLECAGVIGFSRWAENWGPTGQSLRVFMTGIPQSNQIFNLV